ncbi:hypothetical protein K438DRAFT_1064683 [Mycena galopus ATCC 62051]|nr:hypothetical protein K438DRAFT_1064683 [Mycena galopus ATCC 62051]
MARSTSAQAASKPDAASTNTTCEHCGITVKRPTDLPRHMLRHAPDKEKFMYTCPIDGCSHQTLQRSNLNTHIRTHTRTRPYECPEYNPKGQKCLFTTADPSSLHRHRKRKHGYKTQSETAPSGPVASGSGTRGRSVESNGSFESEESFGLGPAASGDADHGAPPPQSTATNTTSYSFIHVPYMSVAKTSQSRYASEDYPPFDLKRPAWMGLSRQLPATLQLVELDEDYGNVWASSPQFGYPRPSYSDGATESVLQVHDVPYGYPNYGPVAQAEPLHLSTPFPPAPYSLEHFLHFLQEYNTLPEPELPGPLVLPADLFPHQCYNPKQDEAPEECSK